MTMLSTSICIREKTSNPTGPGRPFGQSYKKGMSREKSSPSAQYRPILVSAFSPLFERAVFLKAEFLVSSPRVCEAKVRSLLLWVFPCRDGAHRFLKQQA